MNVSSHGASRIRKRSGVSKRSVTREVQRVIAKGRTPDEFPSPLRKYLNDKTAEHNTLVLVYGNMIYFFSDDADGNRMLGTCYPVPGRLVKYL